MSGPADLAIRGPSVNSLLIVDDDPAMVQMLAGTVRELG